MPNPKQTILQETMDELRTYYGERWDEIRDYMSWILEGFQNLPDKERDIWDRETLWNAAKLASTMITTEDAEDAA